MFDRPVIPHAFETDCVKKSVYVKPGKVRQQTASGVWEYKKFCHFAQENVLKCLSIPHPVFGTGRTRHLLPNGACYSLFCRQQLKMPLRLCRLCIGQNTKRLWHSSEATADRAKFLSRLVFTGSASDYQNIYV